MKQALRWKAAWLAPVVLVGGLSACGGDDSPAPVANVPPSSAGASDTGLVAYTADIANTPPQSAPADPVDLDNFTPPAPAPDSQLPVATSADEPA